MSEPVNNFKKADKYILSSFVSFYVKDDLIATLSRNKMLSDDSEEWDVLFRKYTETLIKHKCNKAIGMTKIRKTIKIISAVNGDII